MRKLLWLTSLAVVTSPGAFGQGVVDDFANGNFTHDPEWTGDVERFTVAVTDTLNWLRSDGLATSDTLHLSTASTVTEGYWRFRFRHEVNLSNFNGSRIYLVASSSDLKGPLHGYYVQFGTNNVNRVELWRQDGATADRVRIGESGPVMAGDENTVLIEVTRDELHRWTVFVDGEPVIINVLDGTYTQSAALGVWVKHTSAGRDRFYWTDFVADPDPGDITPPFPLWAVASTGGESLLVQFSKELGPASVTPEAFGVGPDIGPPATAALTEVPTLVQLDFSSALPEGSYVLEVSGVADLAGNVQHGAELAFAVVHDSEPPILQSAAAIDDVTVRVRFDKPVWGCDPTLYTIEPGGAQPVAIECHDFAEYDLILASPLTPQQIYTAVASGVSDLAGNIQTATSATFFFGEYDVPSERDVVVNEIMYAPADLPSNEYVELYNRTADRVFDVSRMRFGNASSEPLVITDTAHPLAPGAYVVLVRNPDAFASRWPGVPFLHVVGFPALLNSGDTVRITRDDGSMLDSVHYRPSWGGLGPALERLDPAAASHVHFNWGDSQHPSGGTPGAINSIYEPDVWPPVPESAVPANDGKSLSVRFNEPLDPLSVLPDAFNVESGPPVIASVYDESDGFVVVLHLGDSLEPGPHLLLIDGVTDVAGNAVQDGLPFVFAPDVDPPVVLEVRPIDALTLLVRFDEPVDKGSASDPLNYEVSAGVGLPVSVTFLDDMPDRVRLHLEAALTGPDFFTLTVRQVEDVHGNAMNDQEVIFFYGTPEPPEPGDIVISEIMYAPADIHSNEYVELYNFSEKVFDLASLTLGDQGTEVPVASESYLLPPGGYSVLVRNAAAFEDLFPGVPYIPVPSFPVLLNGGDAVAVRYAGVNGAVTIDSVFYRPAWGGQGVSLERRSPDGPSRSPTNWASSLHPAGGTPGEANSVAPDTHPPRPLQIEVAPTGDVVVVYFDEPLEPVTVVALHFSITTIGAPASADYHEEDGHFLAKLMLPEPLGSGSYDLLVDGVSDLLGNTARDALISFTFEADTSPPVIASVVARDELTLQVRFDEEVEPASATERSNYRVSDGIGQPEVASMAPDESLNEVELTLPQPLVEGRLYTLTVSGVADLAGNVQPHDEAYFLLGGGAVPASGDVVINEIMFRPAEGESEYVELHNVTDRIFDLGDFTLSDEGAPRTISTAPLILPPHGFLALARNASGIAARFNGGSVAQMGTLPQLRNTGDAVVLRFGEVVIDSLYYSPDWHRQELRDARGVALERLDPRLASIDSGNWTSSLDPAGGTPGRANSVALREGEAPQAPGITVSPSPFDGQTGTVIRYRLAAEAGAVRIRVFDAAGRIVRELEPARLAGNAQEGESIWNGRSDRGESLRVGIYIVLLEAVDLAGATTESYRAPVVLARRF